MEDVMEEKNRKAGSNIYYMGGTIVRRQELEVPDQSRPNERRRRQLEERREKQLIREGRRKTREFSRLYLAGFAAISLAAFVLLGIFVWGEASLYHHSRNVQTLQGQYEELRENNNATQARLEASIDLERIYQIATEERGMSYPAEGQIIDYEKEDREYVRKYEAIPAE